MRKRRICYVGALGLALAVAIPGSAMGQDVQNIEAGFPPQANANVVFGQPASLSSQPSKTGTLRITTFLSGTGPAPSLQTVDIHLPEELTINGKGLPQCDPAAITGQPPDAARAACSKSLVGTGFATVLGVSAPGTSLLFNGRRRRNRRSSCTYARRCASGHAPRASCRTRRWAARTARSCMSRCRRRPGVRVPPGIVVQQDRVRSRSARPSRTRRSRRRSRRRRRRGTRRR